MKAKIEIEAKNPKLIIDSIKPDLEKSERMKINLKIIKNKIVLNVEAEDFTSLMAGINSYLRLIKTSMELI